MLSGKENKTVENKARKMANIFVVNKQNSFDPLPESARKNSRSVQNVVLDGKHVVCVETSRFRGNQRFCFDGKQLAFVENIVFQWKTSLFRGKHCFFVENIAFRWKQLT